MPSMASSVGLMRLSRSQTSLARRASPSLNSRSTAKRPLCGAHPASATARRTASFQGFSPAVAKVAGRGIVKTCGSACHAA